MSDTLIKVQGVSEKFCRSLKKSLWYGLQELGHELSGRRHGGDGELRPDEFWAIKDVSFELKRGECLGLIGRNGAGKTTIMSILTAQNFATSGEVRVFGEHPYENARVLSRICFVRESQRYPDAANATLALRMAAMFFPRWDQGLADRLVAEFRLPMKRRIKKLSRGQLSAVGVIIGLASRAEITMSLIHI